MRANPTPPSSSTTNPERVPPDSDGKVSPEVSALLNGRMTLTRQPVSPLSAHWAPERMATLSPSTTPAPAGSVPDAPVVPYQAERSSADVTVHLHHPELEQLMSTMQKQFDGIRKERGRVAHSVKQPSPVFKAQVERRRARVPLEAMDPKLFNGAVCPWMARRDLFSLYAVSHAIQVKVRLSTAFQLIVDSVSRTFATRTLALYSPEKVSDLEALLACWESQPAQNKGDLTDLQNRLVAARRAVPIASLVSFCNPNGVMAVVRDTKAPASSLQSMLVTRDRFPVHLPLLERCTEFINDIYGRRDPAAIPLRGEAGALGVLDLVETLEALEEFTAAKAAELCKTFEAMHNLAGTEDPNQRRAIVGRAGAALSEMQAAILAEPRRQFDEQIVEYFKLGPFSH